MQAVKHMERPCPGQVPLPCCNARNVTVKKWHCPNQVGVVPEILSSATVQSGQQNLNDERVIL